MSAAALAPATYTPPGGRIDRHIDDAEAEPDLAGRAGAPGSTVTRLRWPGMSAAPITLRAADGAVHRHPPGLGVDLHLANLGWRCEVQHDQVTAAVRACGVLRGL